MTQVSMNEICRILGRLEGHINNLNSSFRDFKASLEELKERVHHLERQHYLWRGGITMMLAVGTLLGSACDILLRWYVQP